MRTPRAAAILAVVAIVLLGAPGCAKKKPTTTPEGGTAAVESQQPAPAPTPPATTPAEPFPSQPVDKSQVAEGSVDELNTVIGQGAGRMPGFPALQPPALAALVAFLRTGEDDRAGHDSSVVAMKYRFTGYRKFLDPDGYPAIAPPWGTLNAIDLNTGEYAWKIPLGEYPELAAQGLTQTGSENYGGPVVTAGGLVFIAATNFDRKVRAFDKTTGALLWQATLPFSGSATPSTYEAGGRQFVVVPAGGGRSRPNAPAESGGTYVAFAIPKGA
jgi:quinoprotein glucose dehydrogenase